MSAEVKEEGGEGFKLTNRGNKLTGQENPSVFRPKIWIKKRVMGNMSENEDFETYEKMFMRKIKFNSSGNNFNEENSIPFVRFLNEFDAQKSLFSKEGIDLDKIFKEENLAKKPLSRYAMRALKSRHLDVLVTLLMLKIEEEQEKYRKLMRLAEELCIEKKFNFGSDGEKVVEDQEDVEMVDGNESESQSETGSVFKRQSCGLEGIDSDEILQLKALCHEHLHQKRVYISTLRKIRSGAVYSLFQANNLCQSLIRLDRKLAFIRDNDNKASEEDENSEGDKFDDKTDPLAN